jgi:hypothetical protein
MARLVPIASMIAILSAPAWSQSAPVAPISAPAAHQQGRAQNYDIPDEQATSVGGGFGSRVLAGTELAPDTLVGFGIFGLKAEKSPHAAATARDLSLTRSRKAAVGLSMRF